MEAETVLINLPTTEAVEQAVFGERGVASAVKPPQLVIDFSTVKVEKGKAFAEKLRAKTGWYGSMRRYRRSAGFRQWHPTVMAGGEAADIARVQPLMADIASRWRSSARRARGSLPR